MADFKKMIPMRWPSGPLEVAQQGKAQNFASQDKEVLDRWHDPAALDLLKGTPVNCLVLNWAGGLPEDTIQQKTAAPLIAAARKLDISVLGWVERPADPNSAIAAASSAGLSGVAIPDFKGRSDFPVIAWGQRAGLPWDTTGPVLAVTDNVWPGVGITSGGDDIDAGPTALPWLDSNSWFIQLARARIQTPLWLAFDPPGKGQIVPAQSYSNAICDTEAAGGRWIISLDRSLRADLLGGAAAAQQTWKQIASAAGFFEKHSEWKSYASLGCVGVISDFAGDNYDLSGEILNLMARRDLLFQVIWKEQALQQSFDRLKALVFADKEQPVPALRQKMLQFIEQGGLLMTGPHWGREGKPAVMDFDTQFEVRAYGKGRIAVAREELSDPYQIAVDAQLLLSHRHDLIKIYNGSSSGCNRLTAAPDSRTALLQTLSYATSRAGGLRTFWLRDRYRSAQVWTIGAEPVVLQGKPSEDYEGMEYHMPATLQQSYVALEFEV
jgi:hypothetical protein